MLPVLHGYFLTKNSLLRESCRAFEQCLEPGPRLPALFVADGMRSRIRRRREPLPFGMCMKVPMNRNFDNEPTPPVDRLRLVQIKQRAAFGQDRQDSALPLSGCVWQCRAQSLPWNQQIFGALFVGCRGVVLNAALIVAAALPLPFPGTRL